MKTPFFLLLNFIFLLYELVFRGNFSEEKPAHAENSECALNCWYISTFRGKFSMFMELQYRNHLNSIMCMAQWVLPAVVCCALFSCSAPPPPRVLIFSRTNGYRHESIETGRDALVRLCHENGIWADTTENPVYFNEKNLKRYAAVVFLNTNGEVLDPAQEADFERYIQAGGGYAGIHSASGTEYTWKWYGGLAGAYFKDHPAIQDLELHASDCNHPATEMLHCTGWTWKEEPYNFRGYAPDLHTLLTVDNRTYKGGSCPEGADSTARPLAWCHEYDGGRAFYTALGHLSEAYSDTVFQKHLLGGIRYAIGKQAPLNYARCRTERVPDQSRFEKTVIADNLSEPMEIAELPDGKIILIERHGQVKLYNPGTGLLRTVFKLPVYSEMGDGLIGLAIDPHWTDNHWIYLYYSSPTDSLNQLSRFVFRGDTLDRNSEKVILTIPVGRKNCFHAAGSMTFDAAGNLFLATGDNTSPFASDGFAPTDEQPGRAAFDAQRSSGNTADLRGKILRIRPLDDGTYICPGGNLFNERDLHIKPGHQFGEKHPAVYVMGCRNPFRISYDDRRNFLFWGDIGPDAGEVKPERGPLGHDEINRARAAGNFGWPYFIADNQAYRDYDYGTRTAGPAFDPAAPVNQSPNNTGAKNLPPAQPALIWYPYGKNRDFPIAGTGGRNAMAGPVYYADQYPAETRFPDYYNGKLIVYDWMRNWLMAVTLDSTGNLYHLEPFADSVRMSRPMDMFFSKNGALWLIEYGTRWYSANEDARLSRIDYVRGQREPVLRLKASPTEAGAPAEVSFDLNGTTAPDGGELICTLNFGDGEKTTFTHRSITADRAPILGSREKNLRDSIPVVSHTYQRPGKFTAELTVRNTAGMEKKQRAILQIGNEPPLVSWELSGRNSSFYEPGDTLSYRISVTDREDGETGIDPGAISTSVDYYENGINPVNIRRKQSGMASSEKYLAGKIMVENSDCKNCHAIDRQVNGPSYQEVARRYRGNKDFAVPSIYRKIIYGGSGNWGKGIMIPHPQIREEQAIQMALWILSLGDIPTTAQAVPLQGNFVLTGEKNGKKSANATYVLTAAYRDSGGGGQPQMESSAALHLRQRLQQAEKSDGRSQGVSNYTLPGTDTVLLNGLNHNAWFVYRSTDLNGLQRIRISAGYGDERHACAGGRIEIRRDSSAGELIGTAEVAAGSDKIMRFSVVDIPVDGRGISDLYFVFLNPKDRYKPVVFVDWVRFE